MIAAVLALVWMVGWYPAIMAPQIIDLLKVSGVAIAAIVVLSTLAMVTSCSRRGGTLPLIGVVAAEAFLMVRLDANSEWWKNFAVLAAVTVGAIVLDLCMPTPKPRPQQATWPPQSWPPQSWPPQSRPPQSWPPPNRPLQNGPPRHPNAVHRQLPQSRTGRPPGPDNSPPPY